MKQVIFIIELFAMIAVFVGMIGDDDCSTAKQQKICDILLLIGGSIIIIPVIIIFLYSAWEATK